MTDRKPTLCVVAGPNGLGKTTTTIQLLNSKVISRYYKSLLNATKAISFVDRAYIYDNSVDNQLPRLLFRTTDGLLFKKYTDDIPEWAEMLLKK